MTDMTTMDLFSPVVPESAWHPNFAAEIRRPNPWNRAVVHDWARGFVDRDGKFVREFQTTFNSCFWELYLNSVLSERGCTVDFSHRSPDFVVTQPTSFVIEAAIASHARDDLPEYRRAETGLPEDLNEFNRQVIIRVANTLRGKHDKYRTNYASLPHVARKPFVIALAPFDRPHFNLAGQRAVEALLYSYYVDEETWIADRSNRRSKRLVQTVKKQSGAEIELGVFQNGSMPEISAVIFSTAATWGKVRALSADPNPNVFFVALRLNTNSQVPHQINTNKSEYRETLLDGLRVYHNPDARWPLSPAIFRNVDVMQSYYRQDAKAWVHEQRDGQLLFRSVFTGLRSGTC